MNQYKRDYIDTGSPKPLYDVLIYGFIGAYILAWPQEYAHYKHEQVRGGAASTSPKQCHRV